MTRWSARVCTHTQAADVRHTEAFGVFETSVLAPSKHDGALAGAQAPEYSARMEKKRRDRYDVSGNVEAQHVDDTETVLVNKKGITVSPDGPTAAHLRHVRGGHGAIH